METKNIRIASVTCTIPNGGTTSGDENFETIHGNIIGFSSHVIQGDSTKAIKLAVKENSNEIARPMHPAFSETENRSGEFLKGLVPIKIEKPSDMSAIVTSKTAVANDVIVEVILAYEHKPY